jgi:hypothetical protein
MAGTMRSRVQVALLLCVAILLCRPAVAQGPGGRVFVDGVPVETRADPTCWPESGEVDADYRYVDCANGTVLDTVTGLLWLQDADCAADLATWWEAVAVVAQLGEGQCGLTDNSEPGDWRLPTEGEWERTVARAAALGCTSSGSGSPPTMTNDPGTDCLAVGPTSFFDAPVAAWTSRSVETDPDRAWRVGLQSGTLFSVAKTAIGTAWPVREAH